MSSRFHSDCTDVRFDYQAELEKLVNQLRLQIRENDDRHEQVTTMALSYKLPFDSEC